MIRSVRLNSTAAIARSWMPTALRSLNWRHCSIGGPAFCCTQPMTSNTITRSSLQTIWQSIA